MNKYVQLILKPAFKWKLLYTNCIKHVVGFLCLQFLLSYFFTDLCTTSDRKQRDSFLSAREQMVYLLLSQFQSCAVAKSEYCCTPLDNQTWQTEWKTAPLAKVQLCEYKNQNLEALLQPAIWQSSGPPQFFPSSYTLLWNWIIPEYVLSNSSFNDEF